MLVLYHSVVRPVWKHYNNNSPHISKSCSIVVILWDYFIRRSLWVFLRYTNLHWSYFTCNNASYFISCVKLISRSLLFLTRTKSCMISSLKRLISAKSIFLLSILECFVLFYCFLKYVVSLFMRHTLSTSQSIDFSPFANSSC